MNTETTYHLDLDALTVIRTDEHGEEHDLNAIGEPVANSGELADFIRELHRQGFFGAWVRDELLAMLADSSSRRIVDDIELARDELAARA